MMTDFFILLYQLLLAHAVTDFAMQSKEMSAGKRGNGEVPPGVKSVVVWPFWLVAHAAVNATGVYLVTGSIICSMLELVFHTVLDRNKCLNNTTAYQDQLGHLSTKVFYAWMMVG